jgi:hypothetical protein
MLGIAPVEMTRLRKSIRVGRTCQVICLKKTSGSLPTACMDVGFEFGQAVRRFPLESNPILWYNIGRSVQEHAL